MIRRVAVAVAILFAPAFAQAQQLEAEGQTHVVESGETLGSIARDHLGSAAEWRRIYEANRDRIGNPDRISPGTTLVIPGEPGAADAPSRVTAVQVAGPEQAPPQDLDTYRARQDLLEARRFEPSGTPDLPAAQRTVFFDPPGAEEVAAEVVFQPPEVIFAVPPGVFQAAGWIVPRGTADEPLGEIVSLSVDQIAGLGRNSLQLYELVKLRFDAEGAPQVGDEFLVYQLLREIPNVGTIAAPTGRVQVVQVGGGEAVAQIVRGVGQIQVGDRLTRLRAFPLETGVHPGDTEAGIEGRIVAFQDLKELYLPGDYAFLDLGETDGLQVGDELIGRAENGDDWTGRELASFQVVGVQEDHATVRVSQVRTPDAVRPGLRVVVVRQMP